MNIYFSGIGGVGIGPLAEVARGAGYRVQGSDIAESLTTEALRSQGIPINIGQDGSYLRTCHANAPIDLFIHTASLPPAHPELLLAKKLGIKTGKRDELISHIIREKHLRLIAVSGTHGKTTTTAMLVWMFKQLGLPISYSVGSGLSFGPAGAYDSQSDFFVYECDEFDRNFLHFSPYLSLITNIDYDHPDTYPTKQSYLDAFRQFVNQSGITITWQKDGAKIHATADDGWMLSQADIQPITLAGAHNRMNATLVTKAAEYLQLCTPQKANAIVSTFPGTTRRFERLADRLYSDYGHHPAEITATLQMAREVSDHVVLIYQPHQNVRQHEIQNLYTTCFEKAEAVYWLPTYLSREDPNLPILTPQELAQKVTNKDSVRFAELNDTLWHEIQKARDAGKLVLAMGAGSIDSWLRTKLK